MLVRIEQIYINSRIKKAFLMNNVWISMKPHHLSITIFVRIKTKVHSSWNFDSRTDDVIIFSGSILEVCEMLNKPPIIKEINNIDKKRRKLRRKKG